MDLEFQTPGPEEADRKRMARRKAWRAGVRKELGKREEFKEEMESVPLEDVEVEEKPLMSMLSMGWREAFKNDRAGFLFPEALRAMISSELATMASCLPMMPGELSQLQSKDAQVLQLRLVSKSVKEAIDDLHSNEAVMSDFPGEFRSVSITYNNLKWATNLTKMFGNDVNPFFFHRLHISQSCYNFQLPEVWKERILARWGKEVWSASIRVSVPPNGYDFLVAYLTLMPNLRRLFINGSFEKMDLNKLQDRMTTNPLPELPYLRFVSTDASWSRPNMVARGGAELESVSGPTLIAHSLILAEYSRNLEVIKLDSVPLPLEGRFPSLQKLELKLALITDMHELANRNMFKWLKNWETPLKELTLVVHGDSVFCHEFLTHVLDPWWLELPHLETLYLGLFHKFEPLDNGMVEILEPCDHGPDHYWSLPEVDWIFYFLRRSNMYGFNIWQWLPKLKHLKVNITSSGISKIEEYTREGYRRHCKLQNVPKDASRKQPAGERERQVGFP